MLSELIMFIFWKLKLVTFIIEITIFSYRRWRNVIPICTWHAILKARNWWIALICAESSSKDMIFLIGVKKFPKLLIWSELMIRYPAFFNLMKAIGSPRSRIYLCTSWSLLLAVRKDLAPHTSQTEAVSLRLNTKADDDFIGLCVFRSSSWLA